MRHHGPCYNTNTWPNLLITPTRFWNTWANFANSLSSFWFFLKAAKAQWTNVWNNICETKCEVGSKLSIKAPERCHWHCSDVFIVNFEHVSHLVLVFLMLSNCRLGQVFWIKCRFFFGHTFISYSFFVFMWVAARYLHHRKCQCKFERFIYF